MNCLVQGQTKVPRSGIEPATYCIISPTPNQLRYFVPKHLFLLLKSIEMLFEPFTLRAPPESIVCYFHTFKNNLGIKRKFKKYLMEKC